MKLRYAIIGDPVEHSRSPELYEPMFKRFGLDAVFLRIRVMPNDLGSIREIAIKHRLNGFAVTMPHKKAITDYLDALDDTAVSAGAVNIVSITGDYGTMDSQSSSTRLGNAMSNISLAGYNTDGDGLVNAMREEGISLRNANVVILGNGGAAQSATAAIRKNGGSILSLTRSAGETLIDRIIREENQNGSISNADILINATPFGMQNGEGFSNLSFVNDMRLGSAVVDMVYRKDGRTPLLDVAGKCGLKAIGGERMLYHQGLLAFKIWTGYDYNY